MLLAETQSILADFCYGSFTWDTELEGNKTCLYNSSNILALEFAAVFF